jgi:hypothetical protein
MSRTAINASVPITIDSACFRRLRALGVSTPFSESTIGSM